MQEQATEKPQGQQECKGDELIEPCSAVCGQSPSGAGTAAQGTRQWER